MMFRRFLLLLAAVLLMIAPAQAQERLIPDELLHDAVMTLTWDDPNGEFWTEGHVVLGESDKGDNVEVYAYIFISNYGFMDGVFTDVGGGAIMPVTFVFGKAEAGYVLQKIIEPEDGERYNASIEAMFPAECVRMMENGAVDREELERQMHEQAQAYLDATGRTEMVQDWRERDLQLANMLVHASNEVTCFSPPYPLWVTSAEAIENGVRYKYSREWYPDEHAEEGCVYKMPDGSIMAYSGVTGTQILTKTRCDDGSVAETITIRADLYTLTVTMADDNGARTYCFEFSGREYYRPTITETGKCGVRYEVFDNACAIMPEKPVERNSLYVLSSQPGNRVHLRTKPASDAVSLGKYYTGTPVEQISGVTDGYMHVRIGHLEGYMAEEYLTDRLGMREGELLESRVAAETGSAKLYRWNDPASEITTEVSSGETVVIIGVDGEWRHVVYGTTHGFIRADELDPAQ